MRTLADGFAGFSCLYAKMSKARTLLHAGTSAVYDIVHSMYMCVCVMYYMCMCVCVCSFVFILYVYVRVCSILNGTSNRS